MAQLFDKILGSPSGRLGDMVFRRKKGGNIIAKQPTPRSSSPKLSEIAFRAKFALTGKIAAGINSNALIKAVWPRGTGKGSKFNEIFQKNNKDITTADDLGAIEVVPATGFDVAHAVVTAGATGIHVVTDALGIGLEIDTNIEKYIVAEGIVILQTPTAANVDALRVLPFKTTQHNLDLINPVDLTCTFNAANQKIYDEYTDRKVYGCILTLDDLGNPIKFSSTLNS